MQGGPETAAVGRTRRGETPSGPANFASWNTRDVKFFRDGGSVWLEGNFNRSVSGVVKYDGAISSPTRGQLFLSRSHFMGGTETFRPMTADEKRGLVKAMEREIAADPDGATAIQLGHALQRIKDANVAAAVPAPAPGAAAGVQDLGHLAEPGKKLRGRTLTLKPGESVKFTTSENQIRGLGTIKVAPAGTATVRRKVLERPPAGMLGGMSKVEYTITMKKTAKSGDAAKITTEGHFQVRNDPGYAFSFNVKAKK